MKTFLFFVSSVALSASVAFAAEEDINHRRLRNNNKSRAKASKGDTKTLVLDILNESFNQPFSPFFVMVHNCEFRILACAQLSSQQSTNLCHSFMPQPTLSLSTFEGRWRKSPWLSLPRTERLGH